MFFQAHQQAVEVKGAETMMMTKIERKDKILLVDLVSI